MAQSTPTNSYCSGAYFRCAYMHHIGKKNVFQQETVAPGLGLLLGSISDIFSFCSYDDSVYGFLAGLPSGRGHFGTPEYLL